MLSDKPIITTVKVNPNFVPTENQYPHFRLMAIHTQTGKYHCLYLFVSAQHYLLLEPKAKRYEIIRRLAFLTEHAPFLIYETVQK